MRSEFTFVLAREMGRRSRRGEIIEISTSNKNPNTKKHQGREGGGKGSALFE